MLLVNPCLGDKLLYGATDQVLESYVAPEEERVQPVQWVVATMEEHSKGIRLVVQHSKVGLGRPWGGGARLARGLLPGEAWGSPTDGSNPRPSPRSAGREAGDLARQRRLLRQRCL